MLSFLLGNKYLAIAKWIAIAGAVWFIFQEWDKIRDYDTLKKQSAELVAYHNAYVATRTAQDKITAQASTDYENAITDLVGQLNAARDAIPAVRVCRPAMQASSTSSASTSKPNDASKDRSSTTNDQLVETISTDEPLQIAYEAAECGKRLNEIQDWVKKQSSLAETATSP